MDSAFRAVTLLAGSAIVGINVVILVSLFVRAFPSIRYFGASFLWSAQWNRTHNQFGALPFFGEQACSYNMLITSFVLALMIIERIDAADRAVLEDDPPDAHRLACALDCLARTAEHGGNVAEVALKRAVVARNR
ncbi:MAG: hypothetical protein ABEJ28_06715 [Salinigranum sp.]